MEVREQLRLALPLAIGHLGMQLMGMVDTAMLGRYSDAALAGAGIANGLLFAVIVLGTGTVMGLDALVPQALGAGETGRARQLLRHGIRVGLLIGVPLTGVAALTPLLLPLAGVDPSIIDEARVYVLMRLPAMIPFMLVAALRSYLQAHQLTRPIVISVVAANLVNIVADGVLIFGDDGLAAMGLPGVGLPALGAAGAALATTVVTLVSLAILALGVRALHREPPPPRLRDPVITRTIIVLGLPIGLHLVAEVGVFAITSTLAGRLGTTPAAAHQIAVTLGSFTFSAAIAIGAAASVRVGRAIGAGASAGARRSGDAALLMGAVVMGSFGVLFLVAPAPLAGLFTNDPEVVRAAVPLLRIAAIFQLSDGAQAIGAGCLRGAGDTRATLYANLVGHYLVSLPLAVLFAFGLGMGAPGLWLGLLAGLTAVALLLIARFRRISARTIGRV